MTQRHGRLPDQASDRRSWTATFRYGSELRTLVAPTIALCRSRARERWGEPDDEGTFDNPDSIYNDLTGVTSRRAERLGMKNEGRHERVWA